VIYRQQNSLATGCPYTFL